MSTDRYLRHSLIDWFSQEDVKSSSFAIVGCGAVGNEVAKNLALLGVGKIDLYDFDSIEIHNLTRSVLFREGDVGKSKAEVCASRIKELDPNIDVKFFVGDFWEKLSLSQAKTYDCILCCVDNFEARIKLNQICVFTKTNLINTGIDSKFCQIEVFPFREIHFLPCYECNLPSTAYERIQKRYSCGWLKKISFVEKKIPTTILTSSITGAIACSHAISFLKNKDEFKPTRTLIDSFTGRSMISDLDKNNDCVACSSVKEHISIVSSRSKIESVFGEKVSLKNGSFITSDPILVSKRCIECDPELSTHTIIFKNASKFDSTITECDKCQKESVEVIIKDSFSISEIKKNYQGYEFPCKFLRYDSGNITTIIELEDYYARG
ncbi:hypothetical protein A7E78_03820 [Syntrophotalea acetylenivorans]|uniref:THIF-type NAD/FAD binding fold domain-containing protein n=1 Tax=Syntrophotalea acetylenivorans TaxID=1842532 RepID=A0A1L3GMB9_9BACT|nr:ThiF family adenylyltransferase [Syntrophotalea acetylenivorans]APG27035.1 hypothetical protein A7E78_03820 [Syntrophotalea acetylenivorans]